MLKLALAFVVQIIIGLGIVFSPMYTIISWPVALLCTGMFFWGTSWWVCYWVEHHDDEPEFDHAKAVRKALKEFTSGW